ncbi:MAG TPA: hypothetical protein EYG46_13430 [Myxococcales bacterium]|nr:hypothetical protein [Myxococcales bacterium]HIM01982.1 hypothetical protein [Myxococcales bacterium]
MILRIPLQPHAVADKDQTRRKKRTDGIRELAQDEGTVRWQDRLKPLWFKLTGQCNINRRIDRIVEAEGFELSSMDRFLGKGPKIFSSLYRGVATKA